MPGMVYGKYFRTDLDALFLTIGCTKEECFLSLDLNMERVSASRMETGRLFFTRRLPICLITRPAAGNKDSVILNYNRISENEC